MSSITQTNQVIARAACRHAAKVMLEAGLNVSVSDDNNNVIEYSTCYEAINQALINANGGLALSGDEHNSWVIFIYDDGYKGVLSSKKLDSALFMETHEFAQTLESKTAEIHAAREQALEVHQASFPPCIITLANHGAGFSFDTSRKLVEGDTIDLGTDGIAVVLEVIQPPLKARL